MQVQGSGIRLGGVAPGQLIKHPKLELISYPKVTKFGCHSIFDFIGFSKELSQIRNMKSAEASSGQESGKGE